MKRRLLTVLIFLVSAIPMMYGTTFYSSQSGYWNNPDTWGASGQIPTINDDVYIYSGHTIWVDATHYCRMLTLASGALGPAVVSCVDYGNASLYASGIIDVQTDPGGGHCAVTAGNGTLSVYNNGTILVRQGAYYMPTSSTFVGNTNEGNRCTIQKSLGSSILTDFYASSYDMYYYIDNNADFGFESERSTFNFCRLTSNHQIDFLNVSFTSCQIGGLPYDVSSSYNNCHFTGCVIANNATMTGANAILDNGTFYEDLTVSDGGSMWGYIGFSSILNVSGDLWVESGGSISRGVGGFLDVYVGGNLSLHTSYAVDNTYFNGNRSMSNPQVIHTFLDINSNFYNQNSSLRLGTQLDFYNEYSSNFEVGQLDIGNNSVRGANVSSGNITTGFSGYVYHCNLSSVTFENVTCLRGCRIMDNNVQFVNGLTALDVQTADNASITLNITGDLYNGYGSDLIPGVGGSMVINLNGSLLNNGTIGAGTLNFVGSGAHGLSWDAVEAEFFCDINNTCPELILAGNFGTLLDLNGRTITGDETHVFNALRQYTLANANLVGFKTSATPTGDPYITTLHNVNLTNCKFNNEVIVTGVNHILNQYCFFYDLLTVSGYFYGIGSTRTMLYIEDLIVQNTGRFLPGLEGQLDLDCHGTSIRIEDTGAVDYNDPVLNCEYLFVQADLCSLYVEGFFKGDVVASEVKTVRLLSSINGTYNSFQLCNLDLNGYTLSSSLIHNLSVQNGTLNGIIVENATLTDVNLTNYLTLYGNGNVFMGTCHNNGAISGDGTLASVTFTTKGIFYNEVQGTIVPAVGREIVTVVEGSIFNYNSSPDAWAGEVHLTGNDPRILDFGLILAAISVNDGAAFSLIGTNTVPELTINPGCSITIPALSSLVFTEVNGWYSGNLIDYGSVTNSRSANSSMMPFQHMYIYPTVSVPEGMITTVQHVYAGPNHLPKSTQEYWKMSSSSPYPEGYITDLKFVYNRPNNIMYEYLNLYLSFDSGNTWVLHNQYTLMGTAPDQNGNWSCVATDVPMNATYALTTIAYDWLNADSSYHPLGSTSTPLAPQFTWPQFISGAQYSFTIATDELMSNIVFTSPSVSDTTFQMTDALVPGTQYYWVVNATSSYIGTLDSSRGTFHTRLAITSFLPTTAEGTGSNPVMFYIPAFINFLLPGEQLTVTPTSSEHLNCTYEEGLLTIAPIGDWAGTETVDLSISDGYTTLLRQIEVTILGSLQYLNISPSTEPEMNIHLSWNAVGNASHYIIYANNTPDGEYMQIAWTTDSYIDLNSTPEYRFFKVTAKNGALPE